MTQDSHQTVVESKVISSKRVVHSFWEKVPMYNKFKNLGSSFIKVFWGILLVFGAMVLTYTSVKSVKEYSKIVNSLKLVEIPANETNAVQNLKLPTDKLVEIQGKAIAQNPLTIEYKYCEANATSQTAEKIKEKCMLPANTPAKSINNLLYYSVKYERYEQHLETEHETQTVTKPDGQEYQETVETKKLVEGWHTIKTDSKWTKFTIGGITIDPINAKTVLKYEELTDRNVYIPNATPNFFEPDYLEKASAQVGDTRITIKYIPSNTTMLVVGKIRDNSISSINSDTFVISNYDKSALVRTLQQNEKTARWGMRILSWALYTFGFMLILGPILALLDFIPIVGSLGRGLTFIISGLISAILVAIGVLLVKYFALFVLLVLIMGAISIFGMEKLRSKGRSMSKSVVNAVKRVGK